MRRGYGESDVTFCIAVQMAVEDTKENKKVVSHCWPILTIETVPWKSNQRQTAEKGR